MDNDPTHRMTDIELLHEPFKALIKQLIALIKERGYDFEPFETLRTADRQMMLLRQHKTMTLKSNHISGLACDFVRKVNGQWTWEPSDYYKHLGECVHEIKGLGWGGDWVGKAGQLGDLDHVELHVVQSI